MPQREDKRVIEVSETLELFRKTNKGTTGFRTAMMDKRNKGVLSHWDLGWLKNIHNTTHPGTK